jgi:hypothetical protein
VALYRAHIAEAAGDSAAAAETLVMVNALGGRATLGIDTDTEGVHRCGEVHRLTQLLFSPYLRLRLASSRAREPSMETLDVPAAWSQGLLVDILAQLCPRVFE